MSLGIVLKGAEGVVLAADSRVTLFAQLPSSDPNTKVLVPATFDNATKILISEKNKYVAALTYGAGAIGAKEPRTASGFMPEFEAGLDGDVRLTVKEFATKLGEFFLAQWKAASMPANPPLHENMTFMVAGYDDGQPYGDVYTLSIPSIPVPQQLIASGSFGAYWGGQREMTDRILSGFDPNIPDIVQELLNIPADKRDNDLGRKLQQRLGISIPWQFLPLQDCVDLAIFIVRATITIQKWMVGIRGVGGAVDVLTITRTEGRKDIQVKQVQGEQLQ